MKILFTRLCSLLFFLLVTIGLTTAQTSITGNVTDADTNEPLIGANVLVKGFATGTITDLDGNYDLKLPEGGETLIISYTGYIDQVLVVGGQSVVNAALAQGQQLDEVVVIGYGTQKSKEVTGAVVSISSEDFNAGNVNSPAQLLQGKVAGLTISQAGGDPNGTPGIRLRGLSTIGAQTEPLVIIDGVVGGSLSNIDPNDIETIDVLKDGSASAIYGTRGSSGVILVTTKKGKSGVTKVDYNGYVSTESISRTVDIASADEFKAAGGNDAGGSTDWYDEISRAGFAHAHNLSLSGGSPTSSYRASFNYRGQEGVVQNTGFDQINGSLTLNQKALNNKLNFTMNLIATDRNADIGFSEAFRYATILNPTSSVFLDDGVTYNDPSGFDSFNPVAMVNLNTYDEKTKEMLANATLSYSVTDNLKIGGSYARQIKDKFNGEYYPSNSFYRGGVARSGNAFRSTEDENNDLYEATAQYTGETEKFSYSLLAGTSYQQFNFEGTGVRAGGYLLDNNTYNQLGSSSELLKGQANVYSYGNSYKLQAQFARLNLNFNDNYFVSASVRREGSDRLGPDNKYGIFPAVSAGADIANLANLDGVDNLKVRVGYGVTGNLPGFNNLAYSIFSPGPQFFFNGGFVPSFGPTTNANPDLKWETKKEINFGVDFAFMDSKITGALDIFNRKTSDLILLVAVPVPPNLAPNTWKNVAAFTTNGIELVVNYDLINTGKFKYTPSVIFTTYRTVLDEYQEDTPEEFRTNLGAPGQNITDAGVGLHLLQEGQPVGQITAPIYTGVDADGAYLVLNQETGESIPANEASPSDWVVVGNGLPDFELSLNNTFSYGNWDANVFLRGAFGHSLVNTYRAFYETSPDNPGANFVNTSLANPDVKSASFNDTHVEDASFVRLDNMSIGYTLNTGDDSAFNRVRLYVAGQNLFTITGYTGVDPEVRLADTGAVDNGGRVNPNADPLAPGVDRRNTYFATRTLTFGANLSF